MSRTAYLGVALATLLIDQATKALVVTHFDEYATVRIIPDFFNLVRIENRGIAFGLFSQSTWSWTSLLLIVFSGAAIVLVGLLLWQMQSLPPSSALGLALILGGAAGNFVDRLVRGEVVDFLDFYVGSYHWPAFNIADSAICIGVAVVLWSFLCSHPKAERAPQSR